MDEIIEKLPAWSTNPLIIGFVLDIILGDPAWLPHPIRWFGKFIAYGEQKLNRGRYKQLKGAIMVIILVAWVMFMFTCVLLFLNKVPTIKLVFESTMVFYGIANRNLIAECFKVERELKKNGIESAQRQLATIVGRDTYRLSESQIRTATLETLSENLSDGVIAPLFFFAIGGIPLMFAYKMVNTLDSMIGYKNKRYMLFGRIAARLDDIFNFVPARLTALLMVLVSFSWRGAVFTVRYGNNHSSPNAGYPEAALAGILNCRFGGANYYGGKLVVKPYIGKKEKLLTSTDFFKACIINIMATAIFILTLLVLN
jgi:adenosylcobinamide-phosphate synthase